jgi:hypothetical protein
VAAGVAPRPRRKKTPKLAKRGPRHDYAAETRPHWPAPSKEQLSEMLLMFVEEYLTHPNPDIKRLAEYIVNSRDAEAMPAFIDAVQEYADFRPGMQSWTGNVYSEDERNLSVIERLFGESHLGNHPVVRARRESGQGLGPVPTEIDRARETARRTKAPQEWEPADKVGRAVTREWMAYPRHEPAAEGGWVHVPGAKEAHAAGDREGLGRALDEWGYAGERPQLAKKGPRHDYMAAPRTHPVFNYGSPVLLNQFATSTPEEDLYYRLLNEGDEDTRGRAQDAHGGDTLDQWLDLLDHMRATGHPDADEFATLLGNALAMHAQATNPWHDLREYNLQKRESAMAPEWRGPAGYTRSAQTGRLFRRAQQHADRDVRALSQAAYDDPAEEPASFHALSDKYRDLGDDFNADLAFNLRPYRESKRGRPRKYRRDGGLDDIDPVQYPDLPEAAQAQWERDWDESMTPQERELREWIEAQEQRRKAQRMQAQSHLEYAEQYQNFDEQALALAAGPPQAGITEDIRGPRRASRKGPRHDYAIGGRPVWPAPKVRRTALADEEEELLQGLAQSPDPDVREMANRVLRRGDYSALVMLHDALLDSGEDPESDIMLSLADLLAYSTMVTEPHEERRAQGLADMGGLRVKNVLSEPAENTQDAIRRRAGLNRSTVSEFMASRPNSPALDQARGDMAKPVQFGALRSPAGGVVVRGIHYPGGKFIPASGPEKAGFDAWQAVERQKVKMSHCRREDGSFDYEAAKKERDTPVKLKQHDKGPRHDYMARPSQTPYHPDSLQFPLTETEMRQVSEGAGPLVRSALFAAMSNRTVPTMTRLVAAMAEEGHPMTDLIHQRLGTRVSSAHRFGRPLGVQGFLDARQHEPDIAPEWQGDTGFIRNEMIQAARDRLVEGGLDDPDAHELYQSALMDPAEDPLSFGVLGDYLEDRGDTRANLVRFLQPFKNQPQ